MTGKAWPPDSDSTLKKGAEGRESKGVRCRIIRKRRESCPVYPRSHGGSKFRVIVKCLCVTLITWLADGHAVHNNKDLASSIKSLPPTFQHTMVRFLD